MGDSEVKKRPLSERVAAAKARHQEPPDEPRVRVSATRVSIELVAGVAAGVLAGYWLDKWLGTSPLFFILCFFLGVAGGAWNIYKLAQGLDQMKIGDE